MAGPVIFTGLFGSEKVGLESGLEPGKGPEGGLFFDSIDFENCFISSAVYLSEQLEIIDAGRNEKN